MINKKLVKQYRKISKKMLIFLTNIIGESKRIRTVPEYGHSRYLRNYKSYKKIFNE